MSQYKVFLCHNSQDKLQVRQIRDNLRQQGIDTWMDEKDIIGFDDWKKKIKEKIPEMNAVAVFLGSSGFGKWQEWEIIYAEEETSRRQNKKLFTLKQETTLRIGLVILSSCQHTVQQIYNQYKSTPYEFLFKYQVVDLRSSEARMQELIGAITGQPERGVDYTQLENFLKARQWKEAEQETFAVMFKAAGREKEGSLDIESIKNFPCTDLRTIDQLWVKYSGGRFGFSVQKRIWESEGGDYKKFAERVGWRKVDWLYCNLTFDTNAPQGHLPARFNVVTRRSVYVDKWVEMGRGDDEVCMGFIDWLFSRVQTCKM